MIGLGVGETHINGLNTHPQCKVVKVYDFSSAVKKAAENKYPNIEFVGNEDEIFCDKEIDVVSIASYDNYHFQQIMKGIENNKHLFVEKPIVQFRSEAEILVKKLMENKSLVLSSNLILRQYQQYQDVKKRIDHNEFGGLSYIYASYNYGRLNKITDGWRGRLKYYSIVLGGGIHLVDLILWLVKSKVKYVFAMGNKIQTKESKFKYNDLVSALLYFENDMIACVNSNFGSVTPHFHQFEVYGTKLSFISSHDHYEYYDSRDSKNYNQNDIVILNKQTSNITPTKYAMSEKINKGFYLYNFIDSILNGNEPMVKQKEIFDSIAVCFAIEKSQELNEKVEVEYFFE